ncbi:ribonuclease H-like domain-containing protein [Halalkalicoccus jeotgali]|uniref:3'-5' exonuclease n=1 Tax=Halalkalicoccus jeotgali (strain DSM 18796 / CECT 7217 / JCM 14584 / KCTC 4019 / B3) TaxID=795797 RepID=D8J691_HALJB|nr:ribonuclease H-like domain-containing protein [Halalkalicoccus jeotgali]ADJ15809.1 predicted exonuclease [Halalkalicoccus jeotgali B3]ELY37167.1 3'-5' exonuclease [Halalkalicoccus jeotgali B3]
MRVENCFIAADGVGERTERKLWEAGLTDWDAFSAAGTMPVGDARSDAIESFIDEARDELDRRNAAFFAERLPSASHWRFYENFRPDACFFDIETTGLSKDRDRVTTASFHRGGETETLVAGEDLTGGAIERELDSADLLVSFNGARFDVPFLETAFDLSIETPHLDLMYPCRKAGLTGGLKAVERELGIEREEDGVDGREAVRLWHAYERGDEAALEKLIRYNRDDTRNLATLADRVASRLDGDVFGAFR